MFYGTGSKRNPPGSIAIEDADGLIPKHITTKAELDELEFSNINRAIQKYFLKKLTNKRTPFNVAWLFQVHYEMFGDVWKWAGKARSTELNLGVSPYLIQEQLKQLIDNFWFWEKENIMKEFEKASRLHHGLVKIHPFKNGNGRWARFITNIYLKKTNGTFIQWPEKTLQEDSPFRKKYIEDLKKADQGNHDDLIDLHQKLSKLFKDQ